MVIAAAFLLGVGGLAFLAGFSGLGLEVLTATLSGADLRLLPVLILLSALSSLVAAERWRLAELRLVSEWPGTSPPARLDCLVLTARGAFLGNLILPAAATALCRGAGRMKRGHGAVSRSVASTVFEQLFDVAVAAALTLSSLAAAAAGSPQGVWWAMALAALAALFSMLEGVFACARHLSWRMMSSGACGSAAALLVRRGFSPLLRAGLARAFIILSIIRFTLLVLTSMVTAAALHLDIAIWKLAASLPPALIAAAVPLTPAGLGTADWTATAFLAAFGTTVIVASQWLIGHRILVAVASFCAAVGLTALRNKVRSIVPEMVVREVPGINRGSAR